MSRQLHEMQKSISTFSQKLAESGGPHLHFESNLLISFGNGNAKKTRWPNCFNEGRVHLPEPR